MFGNRRKANGSANSARGMIKNSEKGTSRARSTPVLTMKFLSRRLICFPVVILRKILELTRTSAASSFAPAHMCFAQFTKARISCAEYVAAFRGDCRACLQVTWDSAMVFDDLLDDAKPRL